MSDIARVRGSEFFESYRAAFGQLDAAAVADHFAYPCHVTSDAAEIGLSAIPARLEWMDQVERLLGRYRAIGFASAHVLGLTVTAISPRVTQAVVHWALRDRAGDPLYDFHASYTLVDTGGTLRIAAMAHDEIPRYRAYLARRGRPAEGGSGEHR